MKEKLFTIPLNDAFQANEECPFCHIERKLEQDSIDFVLGSGASYMESDIREATDKAGFCRHHLQMMYEYGNSLGNALILKTHIRRLNRELDSQIKKFNHGPAPAFFHFFRRRTEKENGSRNSLSRFLEEKEQSCYVCDYYNKTYERYMDTFFYLYKNEPAFIDTVKNSKGFCLHHLKDIMNAAESRLSQKQQETFFPLLFSLTQTHMKRIEEDISWFADKFDYRNQNADWKNSRDAIPRSIQKLAGGYPSDEPYKKK
ncbi:MAG: DUF6062 family protein [Lachnospiraceae bacterium]